MGTVTDYTIRRRLRDGDPGAIVELHRRVYLPEYGRNQAFIDAVRDAIETARDGGWPGDRGKVWLVDRDDGLSGSIALTDEGDGVGWVRWVVFGPELRGQGLGRRFVSELVDEARTAGFRQLQLNTFSALSAAAHLYRRAGFRVISEQQRDDWGPPIVYQHYELEL